MAIFTLNNRIMLYEDEVASNQPKKKLLDYTLDVYREITNKNDQDITLTGPAAKVIELPASPSTLLYILTDNEIELRFNGSLDGILVAPSVAGTKDGFFMKRGSFGSLTIVVEDGVVANCTYFLGA